MEIDTNRTKSIMSSIPLSSHSLFFLFFFFQSFYSTGANELSKTVELIAAKTSRTTSIKPTTRQSQSILGGETCFSDSECASNTCQTLEGNICPTNSVSCLCTPTTCTVDSDCLTGESCAGTDTTLCISRNSRLRIRDGSLTFGPCSSVADCATGRDCFASENDQFLRCPSGADDCGCLPFELESCSEIGSSAGCETSGEICGRVGENNVCADPRVINSSTSTTAPQNTDTSTTTAGTGLTMDFCQSDSNCASSRQCIQYEEESGFSPCDSTVALCFCFPPDPKFCTSDSECDSGETCYTHEGNSLCISKHAAKIMKDSNTSSTTSDDNNTADSGNTDSGSSGGTSSHSLVNAFINSNTTEIQPTIDPSESPIPVVCIAATELAHLPPHKLLFPDHLHASVLCDKYGSCATPGHIVHYNGSPMMMRTYCGLLNNECERKITPVNSPRWSRKLRIHSKSPGLQYTAFAARYETNTEERLLQAAVRLGL